MGPEQGREVRGMPSYAVATATRAEVLAHPSGGVVCILGSLAKLVRYR